MAPAGGRAGAAERPDLGTARGPPGGMGARRGRRRASIAGVACYRPGDRPHLFYHLLVYRRRKGEAKGFTWALAHMTMRGRAELKLFQFSSG